MNFGEKLQLLRKEKKYSQEHIAEQCGVSRQAVSKWESNISYPETDKLIYLSELFGVSIDYLMKDQAEDLGYPKQNVEKVDINYPLCINHWCNVSLEGWDEGYDKVFILGENNHYIFFYQSYKGKLKVGFACKKYIDTVTILNLNAKQQQKFPEIHTNPFSEVRNPFNILIGKKCDIQLHTGNLSKFILANDGYQKAELLSLTENFITVKDGKDSVVVKIEDIAGIVET